MRRAHIVCYWPLDRSVPRLLPVQSPQQTTSSKILRDLAVTNFLSLRDAFNLYSQHLWAHCLPSGLHMTKPLESWARLWDFRRFRRRLHDFSSTDDIPKLHLPRRWDKGRRASKPIAKAVALKLCCAYRVHKWKLRRQLRN